LILFALALIGVVLLGYVNGANDNFKGVATLYGSGTTSYRRALLLATGTTFLGSLASLFIGRQLLVVFSGKGLIPDAVLQAGPFPVAISLGAAATVLLATRLGFPISTTHALTGALVGAGLAVGDVNLPRLLSVFAIPLVASPAVAALLSIGFYPAMRWVRNGLGLGEGSCVCVDEPRVTPLAVGAPSAVSSTPPPPLAAAVALSGPVSGGLRLRVSTVGACARSVSSLLRLDARTSVDWVHYLSASMVSFARGLNDTPKIAGILLLFSAMGDLGTTSLLAIGVAMAVGGLLSARRVAERMSWKITDLNVGQGMAANVVTSFLVLGASRYGVPVSTTHVSCGALFGIGAVTGQARWTTVASILLAWVVTLPVAAATAATAALVYRLALAAQTTF